MDPTPTGTPRTGTITRPCVGVSGSGRPRLARHVRLTFCRTRQRQILQLPETVVVLNGSGAAILELCDGRHTVAEIVAELGARYRTVPDDEVRQFLTRLVARRWVELSDG
ncbi:pyrroloquinoline quinone biosynthesis peptide chaperone PqqD [Streptomyces hirsutus]|uniref:pyrroloquinoline quinone biosynthesis peptide chaperone PqqD n=1 Tax=Streptomyces hirsutus TaxID=35620 RepID=UPI0006E204BC|nr:pyrroloquinoline quinone biosynthesis peptide chaperone PqqD [Streptomyces hirsutus]